MDLNYEISDNYTITYNDDILDKYYVNNYSYDKDIFNEDVIDKDDPTQYISLSDFDQYFPKSIYDEYTDNLAYLSLEWNIKNNKWIIGYKYDITNEWMINKEFENIENIKNVLKDLLEKIYHLNYLKT